jgi:hypothetical protein
MRITPKTRVKPLATRKSRAANVRPLRTWRARNSSDNARLLFPGDAATRESGESG